MLPPDHGEAAAPELVLKFRGDNMDVLDIGFVLIGYNGNTWEQGVSRGEEGKERFAQGSTRRGRGGEKKKNLFKSRNKRMI